MPSQKTKLTVGRGQLFFDPFEEGTLNKTGEVYIGNTPSFSITRNVETVTRMRSLAGKKVVSDPIVVSDTRTSVFSTDNISYFNLANWYGGEAEEALLDGRTLQMSINVEHGKTYFVERFEDGLSGSTKIFSVEASLHGKRVDVLANFDLAQIKFGRIRVADTAPDIYEGDIVDLTLKTVEHYEVNISSDYKVVKGALRYLSNNAVGEDVEYYFPCATLTCSGAVDLKTDDFQQLTFNVEMFPLDASTPIQFLRIIKRDTLQEKTLLSIGIRVRDFLTSEDIVDQITNVLLPNAVKVQPLFSAGRVGSQNNILVSDVTVGQFPSLEERVDASVTSTLISATAIPDFFG